jgi:DNA-binding XRE family transcriptional regulator
VEDAARERASMPVTERVALDHEDIAAAELEDPEYRAEWERTRFAHEVAMRVIQYRVDHSLTQAELARRLGMRQPHVARLEAGDHEPSLTTLRRLARCLDMSFHIDITPQSASELTA